MYVDLATGETYAALIYAGDEGVVFWNPGRESQISAAAFDREMVAVETAVSMPRPARPKGVRKRTWREPIGELDVAARFQWFDHGAADDPAATARRYDLAAYAARNGGQIATHIERPAAPALPPTRIERLRDLFRPT